MLGEEHLRWLVKLGEEHLRWLAAPSNVRSRRIGKVSEEYFLVNTGSVLGLADVLLAVSGMVESTTIGGDTTFPLDRESIQLLLPSLLSSVSPSEFLAETRLLFERKFDCAMLLRFVAGLLDLGESVVFCSGGFLGGMRDGLWGVSFSLLL